MTELTREELLAAARVMADMIDGEWPGPLSYSVDTWGTATPEELDAIRKLEAYLTEKSNTDVPNVTTRTTETTGETR